MHKVLSTLEWTDRLEYQRLEISYDVTISHRDVAEQIEDGLRAWNSNRQRLLWVETHNVGKEDEDAPHLHYCSGRQGILLCYENIEERDDHAEGMRLYQIGSVSRSKAYSGHFA